MTTTAIRAIPRELPHASIYLDDLFEIEDILTDRAKCLPTPVPISFEYILGGEIKVTTREELVDHGGSCSQFSLKLTTSTGYHDTSVISIIGIGHSLFEVPYFLQDEAWELFGKVEQVYKTRRDGMKTFADEIPRTGVLLPWAWALIFPVASIILHKPVLLSVYFGVGILLLMPLLVAAMAIWKKNRIHLRFVRVDQKTKNAKWKERAEKLIWLLVSPSGMVETPRLQAKQVW